MYGMPQDRLIDQRNANDRRLLSEYGRPIKRIQLDIGGQLSLYKLAVYESFGVSLSQEEYLKRT
jgi:hypothetical protein